MITIKSILTAGAWFAIATSALAETEIKFFVPVQEGRSESQDIRDFAAMVQDKTGGSVKIDVNYMGGLGFENSEALRQLGRGFIGGAMIFPPYHARDVPAFGALMIEGSISDFDQHADVVGVLEEAYETVLNDWNIKYLGFIQPPLYDVSIYCKEEFAGLEDLKSRKVRAWAPAQVEVLGALGIPAQIVPNSEMYVALQTGVVDCAVYLGEIAVFASLHEVAPYERYLVPFASTPGAIGINQRVWDGLTDAERAAITESAEQIEAMSLERELAKTAKKTELRAKRAEDGIKMLAPFSDSEVAAFMEAAAKVWKDLAEKGGDVSIAAFEALNK